MKAMRKGLLVALIHVLLVCSLGAKLLHDRATQPRAWVETRSFDPTLPIRGRYAQLSAVVQTDAPRPDEKTANLAPSAWRGGSWYRVRLESRKGRLFAAQDEHGPAHVLYRVVGGSGWFATLPEPLLFFIPDTAADPTRLKPGETLWVEVTIPKKGPPRPIRLAVSRPGGSFTPLDVR
jgi:hypothetical protein